MKAADILREVWTLLFEQPASKGQARAYLDAWASLGKRADLL